MPCLTQKSHEKAQRHVLHQHPKTGEEGTKMSSNTLGLYTGTGFQKTRGEQVENEAQAIRRIDPTEVYRDAVRIRNHSKPVTVFSSGLGDHQRRRLVQRLFGNERSLHRELALRYWKRMKRYQALYNRALHLASMKTFGRPFTFGDYRVSGIGRDEFESSDKDRIRRLVRLLHDYEDIANAHACAGGRRSSWFGGIR